MGNVKYYSHTKYKGNIDKWISKVVFFSEGNQKATQQKLYPCKYIGCTEMFTDRHKKTRHESDAHKGTWMCLHPEKDTGLPCKKTVKHSRRSDLKAHVQNLHNVPKENIESWIHLNPPTPEYIPSAIPSTPGRNLVLNGSSISSSSF